MTPPNPVTQIKMIRTYQVTSVTFSRREKLPRGYLPTQASLRRVCQQLNELDGGRYII
jgi:hypothetical protein